MELKQYLKNCDFLFFVCSGIIASQVILLSTSINETLLIPFINNNIINKIKKQRKYKNKEIEEIEEEIKEYNIEKLVYSLIQIIITVILMKILYQYMLKH